MASNDEQICLLDQDAMVRLWLYDKLDTGAMTEKEADDFWRRYQTDTRFVASYFAVKSDAETLAKLAADMRTPLGRVYFRTYNGKEYVILKGYPGVRRILTGTRYGVQNAKAISMGLGRGALKDSAKGGFFVTAILLTAWDVADYFLRDEATLGQLLGSVASDVTKAAIGGGIAYAAGLAATGTVIGTFALGPLVVAVAVGIGAAVVLDWIDNHYQITAKLQARLDQALSNMRQALAEKKRDLINAGAGVARRVIDLAIDNAIDYAGRKLNDITWQIVPRIR